ncbi:MAG TPA: type I restriction enzyme HsdR N-terminal domain-containing protein [Puia sp.]|nr:type I restriction enzyme HsdR N-terminal domain-containing protein [Puia sp.]
MIKIYYPPYPFKIREPERKKEEIWDELRKLWVRLTPEEWVRQNFIQYLLQVKNYPASYISVEKRMKLGELNKRFDLLVFDAGAHPWMLVECKGGDIKLDSRVLWQVLRYNLAMPVKYLVITNGEECHAFVKGVLDFEGIPALPAYNE